MGGKIIRRNLLLLALLSVTFAACGGGDAEQAAPPYDDYPASAEESPFDAEGDQPEAEQETEVAVATEEVADETDDFLSDPPADDTLADATIEEPTEPAEDNTLSDAPEPADDPLADLLGDDLSAPDADEAEEEAEAEPAPEPAQDDPASLENLFGPPPSDEPAQTAEAPASGDEPLPGEQPADPTHPSAAPSDAATVGDRYSVPNERVAERPIDGGTPPADTFAAPPPQQPATETQPLDPLEGLFGPPQEPAAPDPTAAMNAFFAAMRAGDLEAAYGFVLTPSDRGLQDLVRKQVAKMAEMLVDGTMEITTVEKRAEQDWAIVVARLQIAQNGQTSARISEQFMVLQDGQWKIVPSTIRTDPAIKPLLDQDYDRLMGWYQQNKPQLEQQYLGDAGPTS